MDFDESTLRELALKAREHLETVEQDLLLIAQGKEDSDLERIHRIFQSVHSIRSGAGFRPFPRFRTLAHEMENLLDQWRRDPKMPRPGMVDALLDGVDLLKLMMENLSESEGVDIEAVHRRLCRLSAADIEPVSPKDFSSESSEKADLPEIRFDITPETLKKIPLTHEYLYILKYDLMEMNRVEGKSPARVFKDLEGLGTIVDAVFPPPGYDPFKPFPNEPLRCVVLYSTILSPDFLEEAVGLSQKAMFNLDIEKLPDTDAILFAVDTCEISYGLSGTPAPFERAAIETDASFLPSEEIKLEINSPDFSLECPESRETAGIDFPVRRTGQQVRVDSNKLDLLINLVGELVTAESMVTRNPDLAGLSLTEFDRAAHGLRRIISELREVSISVRMIPLSGAFQQLDRMVRNLSFETGKPVNLDLIGAEIEVDKNVLEQIREPLAHLVRNSIDHGIEPGEVRRSLGKPPVGTVRIEAVSDGGNILIRISDDGCGLNPEKIRARIVESGLADETEAGALTDPEIYRFVFEPGFSPGESPPLVPGRTSGMKSVKEQIDRLRGRIEIDSIPEEGVAIELRIPLTMAVMDGMLIRVGAASFTLPLNAVRESFRPTPDQIILTMGRREWVRVRDDFMPVIRLHRIYDLIPDTEALDRGILINATADARHFCLFVDEIIGHHQAVAKPVPHYLGNTSGISGCTILENGRVGLILDTGGILDLAGRMEQNEKNDR